MPESDVEDLANTRLFAAALFTKKLNEEPYCLFLKKKEGGAIFLPCADITHKTKNSSGELMEAVDQFNEWNNMLSPLLGIKKFFEITHFDFQRTILTKEMGRHAPFDKAGPEITTIACSVFVCELEDTETLPRDIFCFEKITSRVYITAPFCTLSTPERIIIENYLLYREGRPLVA